MISSKARILVRLDTSLSENLRKHAAADSRSLNSMIQHALKQYLSWKESN